MSSLSVIKDADIGKYPARDEVLNMSTTLKTHSKNESQFWGEVRVKGTLGSFLELLCLC